MALKSLYKLTFFNSVNSGYVSGDVVITYWDTTNSDFVIKKNGTQIYSGSTLGIDEGITGSGDRVRNYTVAIHPPNSTIYQFCSGGDLNYFEFRQAFPYTARKTEIDSAFCTTNIVCDLQFEGTPTIVKTSTTTAADGEITVFASSSNGTVRYSLTDEDYSVMTNTTGNFTGLIAGSYIIYAKDPYACLDTVLVTVDSEVDYQPLYRVEYDCLNGDVSVIDIEERDFAGSVTEVKGGTSSPFILRLRGENSDIFTPILTTECSLQLTSETNFQFLNLFTQDDRKYRIIAKKNGTEFWRGFLNPGLYQEQYYTTTNYYVEVEATDQLVILKNIDFLDSSGNKIKGVNSLIKIIAYILSKTDLDLPIRSAVNIFEADMDTTASDDPLEQTHIDTESYYDKDKPKDCYTVLENILLSFGSRLFQWQGYWYIIPVDAYTASIPYREFDVDGVYVSNGTFDPVFDIKTPTDQVRATWANRTQNLEVRRAFGKSTITHKLVKYPESVFNGDFNDVETERVSVRNPFTQKTIFDSFKIVRYEGWSLITNGNTANYYYLNQSQGNASKVDKTKPDYCANIFSDSDSSTFESDAYIMSKPKSIEYNRSDVVTFKFDFIAESGSIPYDLLPYVLRFRWRLKLGIYYLQGDGSWSTDTDLQWVDVFVGKDNFNNWQTLEIKTTCPDVGDTSTTYQISLMTGSFFGGGNDTGLTSTIGGCWELNSMTELQAIPTVDLPLGYILPVFISAKSSGPYDYYVAWYVLETGIISGDASGWSAPGGYVDNGIFFLTAPDDYHATTNNKNWRGKHMVKISYDDANRGTSPICAVRKFDNVSFELLPNNKSTPEEIEYETGNDTKIKDVHELEVLNGDAPNISNAENLYYNWYRYSDGTPTVTWSRDGVDETAPLLQLLSKRVIELHNLPKFKLTGTLKTDTFYGFNSSLYEQHSQKYFLPMAITINDLRNEYDVELQEVALLTTSGAEDVGGFEEDAFTNGFNI